MLRRIGRLFSGGCGTERVGSEGMGYTEFHTGVGGNRAKDTRFLEDSDAANARNLVLEIRQRTGRSQKDLAKVVGVSQSTLSRVVCGRAGRAVRRDIGMSTTDMVVGRLRGICRSLSGDE